MHRDREREQAWGDAVYEAWRRGGNPDAVSMDRIEDNYYNRAMPWHDAAQAEASRVVNASLQRRREREEERAREEREQYEHYQEWIAAEEETED